jgi:Helix-turn-helix domain
MSVLDEPLLPEDEAARELKVKPQTLAAWRHRGQGPAYVQVGKLVRYTPSALRAYIASRIVRPSGTSGAQR